MTEAQKKARDEAAHNYMVKAPVGTVNAADVFSSGHDFAFERARVLEAELESYSRMTVSVKDGYIRLNFTGNPEGPGICFYQGEEWLLGDRVRAALARYRGEQ